jgi:hypothetical protein
VTLCGNSTVQRMSDGCAKRLSGHGATLWDTKLGDTKLGEPETSRWGCWPPS